MQTVALSICFAIRIFSMGLLCIDPGPRLATSGAGKFHESKC
jgi:hypothetical protein